MDETALQYLYPLADKDLLASIRHARLPQSYFGCLVQALQSSFIYDRLIVSWINDLPQPELAAEVADFLMRFEEVDWVVAAGVHEDKLILSMRSSAPDAQAGDILRKVVGKLGKAGGHDRRAGGTVSLQSTAAEPRRGGPRRDPPPAAQGARHRGVPRPAPRLAQGDAPEPARVIDFTVRVSDLGGTGVPPVWEKTGGTPVPTRR